MEKNYREIEFYAGLSIESAIKELKEHKDLVCGSFNGKMLYSDIDDIESAYVKITGKTKAECNVETKRQHEEYEAENKRHKEAIPKLTKEWIKKAMQF